MVPHRPVQTERGLKWFKTSFRIADNSTTNFCGFIPNKEEWSWRTISNKQSNKTLLLHAVGKNAISTIGLPIKTTFGGCMAK